MNILLALDDEISKPIVDYFKSSNYNIVATVNDGQSAIDNIVNLQPDIVVLDLILPKLDGYAVLDFITNKLLAKKPYVIVTSVLTQESFISKAFTLGANDFMARPFAVETLKMHFDSMENKGVVNIQKVVKSKTKILEEQITTIFLTIGIPAHIKGYQFLREAIKLTFDNPNLINNITKELYPAIAKNFETTASKVERAIRHAIEIAWNRGKIENINTLFGYKIYDNVDRPTNSEFIALIADKMLLDNA